MGGWTELAKPWKHRLYHITSQKLNWSHRWNEFFLRKMQFTKLTSEDIESLNRPISSRRNRESLQTYPFLPPKITKEQLLLWKKFIPSGKESACQEETQVRSLGQEDPLKKVKTTHASILAWEIQWTTWRVEEGTGHTPLHFSSSSWT